MCSASRDGIRVQSQLRKSPFGPRACDISDLRDLQTRIPDPASRTAKHQSQMLEASPKTLLTWDVASNLHPPDRLVALTPDRTCSAVESPHEIVPAAAEHSC
mmetsp:Transcript_46202/g.72302  ORF Transcript_46202/g.72302 Transcript_46202/m.72302 type:complete len:102 (-) Transcript_46202:106-411(-)